MKWEYLVSRLTPDERKSYGEMGAALSELGEEGWELVDASGGVYCFKRPKGKQ